MASKAYKHTIKVMKASCEPKQERVGPPGPINKYHIKHFPNELFFGRKKIEKLCWGYGWSAENL